MAKEEFTDAIMLLKADHRKVEELFEKFESASGKNARLKIVEQVCLELKIHAQIEEELFYPAFRGKIEDDILDEAHVEHDGAKVLINDLLANGANDEYLDAKVTVLSEEIAHHVGEEEKPKEGMFAQCRQTDVDLVELRDRLMARKQELLEQAKGQGLPPAELAAIDISATMPPAS